MKQLFLIPFFIFLGILVLPAQTYYRLDATNDGSTINLTCPIANTRFADDGANSTHYANGVDRTITFCAPAGKLLKFDFGCGSNLTIERIHSSDTLFIYNGNSTAAPLLYAVTGNSANSNRLPYFDEGSDFVFLSTGSCITFRLKANASNNDDGWDACISCVDPISCGDNEPASDLFGGAPYICNLSGYCGKTSGDFGSDFPINLNTAGGSCPSGLNFLGTIENNSWIKFIADSTAAIFDFNVPLGGSCLNGIQTAVFSYNGTSLTRMSPCVLSDNSHSGNFQLIASGLSVGETYYIMTDGNAGDICDFTINANVGVATVNAGQDQFCAVGSPVNLSASGPSGATYTWNSLDGLVVNEIGVNQTFNPTVTTTYVVEVSGGGICVNQTDTVVVTKCIGLPVSLLNFKGSCKENKIELEWQTASEINNDYFEVEKAKNAVNFIPIGRVYGNGNSSVIQQYNFQDLEPNNGVAYYRLKQVDFNADVDYSSIIAMNSCNGLEFEVTNLYYNSQQHEIVVNLIVNNLSTVLLKLIDVQGKLILNHTMSVDENQQEIRLPISGSINSGIYVINFVTDNFVANRKLYISNQTF